MDQHAVSPEVEGLDAFIGEWSMQAAFPMAPPTGILGRTVFEWLPGERFLVQRWEVPHRDARTGSRSSASIAAGTSPCSTTLTRVASPGCTR
jgi:hypothetical protein